jgi:oxygen-dependent protoporphyrinogen oxidase
MKVIVAGAGIAGLGAATYFTRKGHEVSILEAADRIGGRAITQTRRGTDDRVDVGTQYYHTSYQRGLGLIRDVGLEGTMTKIVGNTRFFDDRVASGSFLLDHRLPWFRSAGFLGNVRLGSFLIHRLLRHRMNTFALEDQPITDRLSGLDLSSHPALREFLVRPLTVAGAITEPEETDVSLLHLLRLVRIILLTDYLSLSGGIASLHTGLAERLNVETERPVERLVVEGGRVVGVELAGSGEVRRADHVVVATTPEPARGMLPEDWTLEREFLGSVTIPAFAFPTYFLDRPFEKRVWSYMAQHDRGKYVSVIIDAGEKNRTMVPSGKAVIQPWPCYPASQTLIGESDDKIIDACTRELEEYFPGFSSWIEEVHMTRHPYAVPFQPVGHQTRAQEFVRSADARGVSFCGDYLSGGYLEPALWSAERASERFG